MITDNDIEKIIDNAIMIIYGYAFLKQEDGNIRIISIESPYHASVIQENGEILETNMDDVELDIVNDIWKRNKKYMEDNVNA
jgi:hypothetical protein